MLAGAGAGAGRGFRGMVVADRVSCHVCDVAQQVLRRQASEAFDKIAVVDSIQTEQCIRLLNRP